MLCSCVGVLPANENETTLNSAEKKIDCGSSEAELKYSDKDVDFDNFIIPSDYNLEKVLHAVTDINAPGWIKLEGVFSKEDVEMARERVAHHTNANFYMRRFENQDEHEVQDELHNNYKGLVWALISKGKIFEKMAQHPIIVNVSSAILGQTAQISSLAANTVLPGMKGQLPHVDYPYYRNFLPKDDPFILDNAPQLATQFITLLTDFTEENGATALRPYSHIRPRYPDDPKDFFANSIQMTGKAGDMVIFAGAIQHCAMENGSKGYRSGILQHMAPSYVKPFEDILAYINDDIRSTASPTLRGLLGLDNPYPIRKA